MESILAFVRRPAWPILLWAGLAAAFAAAFVLTSARDRRGTAHPAVIIALGLAASPLYALAFEAIGRADILTGALLGLIQGGLAFLRRRRADPRPTARIILGWIVFGAVLGYLYPGVAA